MKKPSFINSDEQRTYKLRVPVEIQALEIEERSKTFQKANTHKPSSHQCLRFSCFSGVRLSKRGIRILVENPVVTRLFKWRMLILENMF